MRSITVIIMFFSLASVAAGQYDPPGHPDPIRIAMEDQNGVFVGIRNSMVSLRGVCEIDGMPCDKTGVAELAFKKWHWVREEHPGARLELRAKDGLLNPFGETFDLVLISKNASGQVWDLSISWASSFGLYVNVRKFENLILVYATRE